MVLRTVKAISLVAYIAILWALYSAVHIERYIDLVVFAKPIYQVPPPITGAFTPEVEHWWADIDRWASARSLDPYLVATVMQIESCGDPQAVSPSGAQGLFQVMPFHFSEGAAMLDPETNAAAGLSYLVYTLNAANGDPNLAMAAYNGGPGLIGLPKEQWPDETRDFYYWGSGIYAEAKSGSGSNQRLQEWLDAGGRMLCGQATRRLQLRSN
jgi:soluble lytic murein transglycosylase-like protein